MKNDKLSLRLDDLRVDSFDTSDAVVQARGTVRAHQEDEYVAFDVQTAGCTGNTCANTCGCPTWADNSCYPRTYCIG
jgi:hypothetical protein